MTAADRPEPPVAVPALRRGLRPVALFATVFVLLCGGTYGLEEVVPRSGPGLSIAVLLLMALVWAAPYALLVSEMASALLAGTPVIGWGAREVEGVIAASDPEDALRRSW